ncbi:MAG TPA: peptide deformylase [Cyclobacteriaceae bacterium]|nr:peptide deformylase [Cyclobacteriaceae bacterium]
MIFPIVAYGDPILRKKALPVDPAKVDIPQVSNDLFETMHGASGVGLAAPQIGKSIRMFVIDASPMEDEKYRDFKETFINPVIIEQDGEHWNYEEGCLSIPGIREEVARNEKLKIRYLNIELQEVEREFDGILARIIQHEYDHIEGVLFIDKLTGLKKRLLKGKLAGISRGEVDVEYAMRFPKNKK